MVHAHNFYNDDEVEPTKDQHGIVRQNDYGLANVSRLAKSEVVLTMIDSHHQFFT